MIFKRNINKHKQLLITFLLLVFDQYTYASYSYSYTPNCARAYEQYTSLHLSEANGILRQEIIRDPYNLMVTYLSDYDDYFTLLLNGDKNEFDQRRSHMDDRLDLLSKGDDSSPWYKLCKAGIYFHWAIIYMRFGENMKATFQFRRSFILLKENQKKFPDFQYNDFFYGVEETAVGAIPDEYKWIASLFGLKGKVRNGLLKLSNFNDKHSANDLFKTESVILYNFMKFYLLYKQEEVWRFLAGEQFKTQNNLLNTFIKGNMALNYRKADIAIQTFIEGEKYADYNKFPLFEYQVGCAYYLKLDEACISHFKLFLERYHGNLYVKDAWYKMALFYYTRQNMQMANYCRSQISKQGNTMVDVDKTAKRFAENNIWPDRNLLKAHLQIDGGYYKQAQEVLNAINENSLATLSDKLEYYFRMGRVDDELGNKEKALALYQKTITMGHYERDYFAARAALQMAFIYEKAGNTQEAIARYEECLSMKHHDFQNAIDQQAKAGVNRLTVK